MFAYFRSASIMQRLFWILFLALILRWLFLLFSAQDPLNLTLPDSIKYLSFAETLDTHGLFPNTSRLPLYPIFLTFFPLGSLAEPPQFVLVAQTIIDTLTVLLIALIAYRVHTSLMLPAAFFAAINPNMIGHSTIILTDSLALFFITLHFYYTLRDLQNPSFFTSFVSGAALGLAMMTRPIFASMILIYGLIRLKSLLFDKKVS
ncbi:glycosyltransferase family 39 protein, partial [Magnetococcales bacterium HHB-1]